MAARIARTTGLAVHEIVERLPHAIEHPLGVVARAIEHLFDTVLDEVLVLVIRVLVADVGFRLTNILSRRRLLLGLYLRGVCSAKHSFHARDVSLVGTDVNRTADRTGRRLQSHRPDRIAPRITAQ